MQQPDPELQRLEAIANQADQGAHALDNPQAAPGAPGTDLVALAPPGPDYAGEAAMCVDMFASMVCGYAPKAEAVWTPAARERTAAALAPVLAKYGVSMGALPCELVLLVTAGPLLWQSSRLVAQQMADEKRQAQARRTVDGEAREVPDQAGQAPGPAVHPQTALYPA